jgi:hypothetical protein
MSLSNPSPICTVNATSTINGVDVLIADTNTIALADTAGVKQWSITCINTDDLLSSATITAGLTIDTIAKTATFYSPVAGSALIFQSKVNNGKDANGTVDPSLTTTFGVYVKTGLGFRVAAFDEKTEGSGSFGWITKINAMIRNNVVTPLSDVTVASLAVVHDATIGESLYVTQNTHLTGLLYCGNINSTGFSTSGIFSSANQLTCTTLAVTGASALHAVTCTTLGASGNATVGGTLGVTGATSCAAVTCTTLGASGNCTVGGTLGVTGAFTCTTLAASGNCTVGGTLGITGTLSAAAITCTALSLAGTAKVVLASRSITRTVAAAFIPLTANWAYDTNGGALATTSTTAGRAAIAINVPEGAVINTINVYFAGAAGHAGAPATPGSIRLYSKVPSTGVETAVTAAASTTYASAGAYEAVHAVTLSTIAYTVTRASTRLYVTFTSESGANALLGETIHGCDVTYTTTSMDDGPCN